MNYAWDSESRLKIAGEIGKKQKFQKNLMKLDKKSQTVHRSFIESESIQ
ncbi:hypothetical protein [Holdemania filiformis]|uniref:Uncharacterized protein n=1 Tax=Holdemania filiformis DSM 12042 TaxID=545696 RepID=B9Y4E2_9FIRM|nr:hypothetical protein HOLDEFILI_00673 [Holdemania filiformis DSM 12042]